MRNLALCLALLAALNASAAITVPWQVDVASNRVVILSSDRATAYVLKPSFYDSGAALTVTQAYFRYKIPAATNYPWSVTGAATTNANEATFAWTPYLFPTNSYVDYELASNAVAGRIGYGRVYFTGTGTNEPTTPAGTNNEVDWATLGNVNAEFAPFDLKGSAAAVSNYFRDQIEILAGIDSSASNSILAQLAAEIAARIAADTAVSNALRNDLDAELVTRAYEDLTMSNSLQGQIDAEVLERAARDVAVSNALRSDLLAEIALRASRDVDYSNSIMAYVTAGLTGLGVPITNVVGVMTTNVSGSVVVSGRVATVYFPTNAPSGSGDALAALALSGLNTHLTSPLAHTNQFNSLSNWTAAALAQLSASNVAAAFTVSYDVHGTNYTVISPNTNSVIVTVADTNVVPALSGEYVWSTNHVPNMYVRDGLHAEYTSYVYRLPTHWGFVISEPDFVGSWTNSGGTELAFTNVFRPLGAGATGLVYVAMSWNEYRLAGYDGESNFVANATHLGGQSASNYVQTSRKISINGTTNDLSSDIDFQLAEYTPPADAVFDTYHQRNPVTNFMIVTHADPGSGPDATWTNWARVIVEGMEIYSSNGLTPDILGNYPYFRKAGDYWGLSWAENQLWTNVTAGTPSGVYYPSAGGAEGVVTARFTYLTNAVLAVDRRLTVGSAEVAGQLAATRGVFGSLSYGPGSSVSNANSFAGGAGARATNDNTFVWSGIGEYPDHGIGTFSINPLDGISNVWIGEDRLSDMFLTNVAITVGDVVSLGYMEGRTIFIPFTNVLQIFEADEYWSDWWHNHFDNDTLHDVSGREGMLPDFYPAGWTSHRLTLDGGIMLDTNDAFENYIGGLTVILGPRVQTTNSLAVGAGTVAFGQGTAALGLGSFAEGLTTHAMGDYSHAEGENTDTYGRSSHAEGYFTTASGTYSHAEGYWTLTTGTASHAEGYFSATYGFGSKAAGFKSIADEIFTFVWQGAESTNSAIPEYHSNGPGTFNVSPIGGASGFFVGSNSLEALLSGVLGRVDTNQIILVHTGYGSDVNLSGTHAWQVLGGIPGYFGADEQPTVHEGFIYSTFEPLGTWTNAAGPTWQGTYYPDSGAASGMIVAFFPPHFDEYGAAAAVSNWASGRFSTLTGTVAYLADVASLSNAVWETLGDYVPKAGTNGWETGSHAGLYPRNNPSGYVDSVALAAATNANYASLTNWVGSLGYGSGGGTPVRVEAGSNVTVDATTDGGTNVYTINAAAVGSAGDTNVLILSHDSPGASPDMSGVYYWGTSANSPDGAFIRDANAEVTLYVGAWVVIELAASPTPIWTNDSPVAYGVYGPYQDANGTITAAHPITDHIDYINGTPAATIISGAARGTLAVTNDQTGVTLAGSFSGNAAGLTNLPASSITGLPAYITNGTSDIQAGASFTVLNNPSSSNQSASLKARTLAGLPAAVPFFTPVGSTSPQRIAFDLFPKGNPTDHPGVGVAWIDLCDTDITNANAGNFEAVRLGKFAAGPSYIASAASGSGSVRDLAVQHYGGRVIVGRTNSIARGTTSSTVLIQSGATALEIVHSNSPALALNVYANGTVKLHDFAGGSYKAAILMTNGAVVLPSCPTSSSGLMSGAIYSDGGTLKIVP